MPTWLPSLLVPIAEFFFVTLPALAKGTPAPPPPDARKPGFDAIDAKVDGDRAKARAEHERSASTTPATNPKI